MDRSKLQIDPIIANQLQTLIGQVALSAYMHSLGLGVERFGELFDKMNEEQKQNFMIIYQRFYEETFKQFFEGAQNDLSK